MLSAIVGTTKYSLDNGTIARLIAFDGWGMAPTRRFSIRGPMQHGDTDNGWRFDPRFGNLVFLIPAENQSEMYNKRAQLLDIFNPSRTIQLEWILPNGDVKQIDCKYVSDLSMGFDVKNWTNQRYAVTLKAPDPAFYNPEQTFFQILNGVGSGGWAIPWAIDWPIGASTLTGYSIPVIYNGTFPSYPIINITGPVNDLIITNESTGEKFDFTGFNLGSGNKLEIDCRYGYKTVLDPTMMMSYVDKLSTDSDLATFHIADSSEVAGGVNVISVSGSAGSTVTNIYMTFYTRYNGL